jgi:hypothetical protein
MISQKAGGSDQTLDVQFNAWTCTAQSVDQMVKCTPAVVHYSRRIVFDGTN